VPTIICPHCRTENQPAGLSALNCESCHRTIDPRELGSSTKDFIRRQRRLRKKSGVALQQDEADELLEWVLGLPPHEVPIEAGAEQRRLSLNKLMSLLPGPCRWSTAMARRQRRKWLYTDTVVRMGEDGLVINRYYWPVGRKRIPYTAIRRFTARPLAAWHGQYRVQGIDHRGRWYSRDRHRGEKERAIDLTVGKLIRPVLTPDDVDAVLHILERKVTILERKVTNDPG
jgi:hypothetical protein